MEITAMRVSDIPEVVKIEIASFANPWSAEMFEQEMLLGRYFVARENNRVVGYAGYQKVLDEGHINNLAVKAEARRRGIARLLIGKIIEECQGEGIKSLTLEVREKNLAAQNLYRSLGFSIAGKRKGYYQDPVEDAILMTRRF